MRFSSSLCSDQLVDADERISILHGIIYAWRTKPQARKDVLDSREFPTKFKEVALPGYYELNLEDLRDLFVLLKEVKIGIISGLSEEETRNTINEQQRIFNFLKSTLKQKGAMPPKNM